MRRRANKATKDELRRKTRLTRPPRLEGKAKNAALNPVRKRGRKAPVGKPRPKPQGYSGAQRKAYQLKSKRRR